MKNTYKTMFTHTLVRILIKRYTHTYIYTLKCTLAARHVYTFREAVVALKIIKIGHLKNHRITAVSLRKFLLVLKLCCQPQYCATYVPHLQYMIKSSNLKLLTVRNVFFLCTIHFIVRI